MWSAGEMEEQDVNESVDSSVEDSSTSEGEVNEGLEADSTAESENTEEEVPFHKHPRWQKVLKERNEIKEKLQKYMEKDQSYGLYEQFDQLLAANPELYEQIKGTFSEYYKRTQQGNMGQQQPQIDPMVQGLQREVYAMKFEKTRDSYQKEFNELTKDIPDEYRPVLEQLTEVGMYRRNSAPYQAYTPGLVAEAFKEARKIVDKAVGAKIGSYVNEKASDSVPTAGRGGPVVKDNKLDSQEKRAAFLAEGMKRG